MNEYLYIPTVVVLAVVWPLPAAHALINPGFTPVELVKQSALIVEVDVKQGKSKEQYVATVGEVIKGKTDLKAYSLDLSKARNAETAEAFRKLAATDGRGVLFIGEIEDEDEGENEAICLLHISEKWAACVAGDAGNVIFDIVQNFLFLSEEALARYYNVPLWSEKHLTMLGQAMALMAEANSRQICANLAVDFHNVGSNAQSLIRWIKQPDGSYKHDYTIFDKYMDTVAKSIGKPRLLRLNCWGGPPKDTFAMNCAKKVSSLDPATGKLGTIPQPGPGTAAPGNAADVEVGRPVPPGAPHRLLPITFALSERPPFLSTRPHE